MAPFKVASNYTPSGDQPQAIQKLAQGVLKGDKYQTLLGVTGSGKTYTMAKVVEAVQKPTLVISHNKTLAAQLYGEFREFFPRNAVHYFVSFYDYYLPEAYIPQTDTYIEKDLLINDEINKLRLAATAALLSRRDVIIVASVSCIYGIGSPEEFEEQHIIIKKGDKVRRADLLRNLITIRYERNDVNLDRGKFRARGDVIDIFPAYLDNIYRVELFDDEVEKISEFNPVSGEIVGSHDRVDIFPAKHFMTKEEQFQKALFDIEEELQERIAYFISQNKLLEAQRIEQRTNFDLEMLREVGYCHGIENYTRHLSGLAPGQPPYCLVHFFPEDFLVFIDESHASLPQLHGMYRGDRSRKQTLVDYGFRLPSALDNRPLRFDELEKLLNQTVFVSATPSPFEIEKSSQVVEQIIRPTGLIDPQIRVHPVEGQIDHLIGLINERAKKSQRVLVTTLTKKMSEDLSDYLSEAGIKVRYLHSEIETLERVQIIKELREGKFDVLVGINLLREGLDLPEVSLVAILDADKQGFLRSETSLIQTAGRAARNIDGEVVLFADQATDAIKNAISETQRRREIQINHNQEHGITPTSIEKSIKEMIDGISSRASEPETDEINVEELSRQEIQAIIEQLEEEMRQAAKDLEFERAAAIRDQIAELKRGLET